MSAPRRPSDSCSEPKEPISLIEFVWSTHFAWANLTTLHSPIRHEFGGGRGRRRLSGTRFYFLTALFRTHRAQRACAHPKRATQSLPYASVRPNLSNSESKYPLPSPPSRLLTSNSRSQPRLPPPTDLDRHYSAVSAIIATACCLCITTGHI